VIDIIADIGSNHRGSLDLAKQQIESAAECGVTHVKFQYFSEKELYGFGSEKPSFPSGWLPELKSHCDSCNVEFMCSAFSPRGVEVVDPFVKRHKLASSEALDINLLEAIGKTGKPAILSTGAQVLTDIEWVLARFSFINTVLECVSAYPAKASDYNLSCLSNFIGRKIGISDHAMSFDLALVALGAGCTVFEYHFDGIWENYAVTPDTPVSLDQHLLTTIVQKLHSCYEFIKAKPKYPTPSEDDAQFFYKRRLVATKDLPAGTTLTLDNFGIYRSKVKDTRGAQPRYASWVIGKKLKTSKTQGESISLENV